MRKWGFIVVVASLLAGRGGADEPAPRPEMSDWSVVKMVQAGRDAMAAGDRAKARSLAEAAVAKDSGYADSWKLLGTVRLQAGETNSASQAFRTALLIAPSDPVINRELAWLLWNEDREKALASLDVLLQSNVGDRDAVIRRVLSQLAETGNEGQALELYQRWKPGFSTSELGMDLYQAGRRQAAVPFLKAAWEAGENRPGAGLYLAYVESRRGKGSRVQDYLKAALERPPAAFTVEQMNLLWESALSLKADSSLSDIWKELETRFPDEQGKRAELADRFEKAAYAARRRSDGDTALFLFRQTMNLDPNRVSWADWVLQEERDTIPDLVKARLTELLPRGREPAIRDGMAARLAHYQGDLESAVLGYRKSISVIPDQLVLRVFLVRALLAGNKPDEARRELQAIEAMGGEVPGRTREDMAEFWLEVGDVPRAAALDRTLLTRKSKLLLAENELESACEMAALAIANDAANADAWLQFGVVQGRRQQYAGAKMALDKAIALNPGNAGSYQELGWTLWGMGEKNAACEAWTQALSLGVPDRARLVRQIVGRMAEENQKELALEQHAKWLPEVTTLATGLDFARSGRMKAAEPFLAKAWDTGAERELTGLFLGYARALNGVFAGTPAYFTPFIASCVATAAPSEVAMIIDGLRVCSGIPGSVETLDTLAKAAGPEHKARITDVYFAYGRDEAERGNLVPALELYEKALARDPDRVRWVGVWDLTERMNNPARGLQILDYLQAHATSVAVQSGVAGKRAEVQGDYTAAVSAYESSLAADPGQVEIRKALFDCQVKLGDLEKARREVEWMAKQVEEGVTPLRDILPLMWTALGEDEKALATWQFLHLTQPEVGYYVTGMALAQYRTGKGEAAVESLTNLLQRVPLISGYELLAQILVALGRPAEAAKQAREGLKLGDSVALRRLLAETLETSEPVGSTATVDAARKSVADDPGSASQSVLLGRSLAACGRMDEAVTLHQELLGRNPLFAPSLMFLRDQELVARRPHQAIPYAERLAKTRPWDDMAIRRYAMALAEADRFSQAIRVLKPMAKRDEKEVITLLLYGDPTIYDYPGRNTAAQIISHIACLASNGFVFVTGVSNAPPAGKLVKIILVQPDRAVVEAVDAALQQYNAAAVMVVSPRNLRVAVPRMTSPQRLAELRKTGRWQIAVTLPESVPSEVRADGVKGNPLTHRIRVKGVQESVEAMTERVTALLSSAAVGEGEDRVKVFYYPGGDYGQLSLDTEPAVVEALSNAVSRSFVMAVCKDDNGFFSGAPDLVRLPAKSVPPVWNVADLEYHILQGNSVVRARLELAKLMYWHGQNESAAYWFRKAAEAGANPFEVTFNQAANAAMEGDLAEALKKSREAVTLAEPGDKRPAALLERVTDMRRPTATLDAAGWWDNEDRSYWESGVQAQGPVKDWLRWEAGLKRHNWEQKGKGNERATSADLGFLAYVAPEVWVEAGFQEWLMDDLDDETGWRARLRLPNPLLRGYVNLISRREMMETVEALREGITAHREGVETYSRVLDFWDCFADFSLTQRSDENDTWWGYLRFVRRLKETPYIGVGYAGRFADSSFDAPEYWSPEELQQHQLYAALQGSGDKWGAQLSGQAGYALERNTDWRYVVGGRLSGIYRMTQRLNLGGDVQYQEGPVYDRLTLDAYLKVRW